MQICTFIGFYQRNEFTENATNISTIDLVNKESIFVFRIILCFLTEGPENTGFYIIVNVSVIIGFCTNAFHKVFIAV